MKNLLIISFLILIQSIHAQDSTSYNYIESGYYQLIYEADIAYLEGNDDLAFEKLQEAERRCPLLNQLDYQEMDLYATLLMKRKEFDKALHFIDRLATEYGIYPKTYIDLFYAEDSLLDELLVEFPDFNDSIFPSILNKKNDFYTPERMALIERLTEMVEKDQNVRIGWEDAQKDPIEKAALRERMIEVDSLNLIALFDIMDNYGFPNNKMFGDKYLMLDVLFVHNFYNEILKEKVLQYIRDGECPPYIYGFMIDRNSLETRTKFVYGIYDNASDGEIIDIEYIDERRKAIGMPTREMEKMRKKLLLKELYEWTDKR